MASVAAFLSTSWNLFVGIFLYYAVLALVTLSGADLDGSLVACAYGLPLVVYAALLVGRGAGWAARAFAAIEIDLFRTPQAL